MTNDKTQSSGSVLSDASAIQTARRLHQSGRRTEAQALCQQILSADPGNFDALFILGVISNETGNNGRAMELLRQAVQANPSNPFVHNSLALVLDTEGQADEAATFFRKAISLKPDFVVAYYNLGTSLAKRKEWQEAESLFRKVISQNPRYFLAYHNLGTVLEAQGQFSDAADCYHNAVLIKPDYHEACYRLSKLLLVSGRLDEARQCVLRVLALKPDHAPAHSRLGNILSNLGKFDEAIACFRKARSIQPDYVGAYDELLFLYSYNVFLDSQEYLSVARGWEQTFVPAPERQVAGNRDIRRPPLIGRRLKLGYVSGDFRQHAVRYFLEQFLAHHDRGRLELFAYSTHGREDAVTERFKALVDHWKPLAGIADTAARERIEADGIDVLIDLSGHTSDHRMGIFARRAAPVQAHYLGYFASTGLTEMDYWIGDGVLTPPETDSHFSEQLWRLPRVWVAYAGDKDAPEPQWRPAEDGAVWLGSFNKIRKLTPATFDLWARVLHALPEGRLLLKTKELVDAGSRQRILDEMASRGIPSSRMELQDLSVTPGWSAHMAYYGRLDIALDPVGSVGGGTTTCDALWMGVPVVTLAGDRMASRMGSSMLDAIGHPEWIARSEQEYIEKVVALARNPEQRRQIRLSLRSQMARSPLCDAKGLAAALEDAYFAMFDRWEGRRS